MEKRTVSAVSNEKKRSPSQGKPNLNIFFFQRKKLHLPLYSRKPPSQHHLPLSEIETIAVKRTIPCAESKILFSEDAAKPLNKKTEKVKFVTTSKSGCCESQHKEKRRNQSRRSEEDQPLEKKNESPSFLATQKKKSESKTDEYESAKANEGKKIFR